MAARMVDSFQRASPVLVIKTIPNRFLLFAPLVLTIVRSGKVPGFISDAGIGRFQHNLIILTMGYILHAQRTMATS